MQDGKILNMQAHCHTSILESKKNAHSLIQIILKFKVRKAGKIQELKQCKNRKANTLIY